MTYIGVYDWEYENKGSMHKKKPTFQKLYKVQQKLCWQDVHIHVTNIVCKREGNPLRTFWDMDGIVRPKCSNRNFEKIEKKEKHSAKNTKIIVETNN